MLRTNFLYHIFICTIFILFNFILFEDYALPHIYDCATLHHPTVYGTIDAPRDHAARWRHSVTSLSSSFSYAGNSVTYSHVTGLAVSSTVRFTITHTESSHRACLSCHMLTVQHRKIHNLHICSIHRGLMCLVYTSQCRHTLRQTVVFSLRNPRGKRKNYNITQCVFGIHKG
jgi:nitrous oxidase accessory protein NosD